MLAPIAVPATIDAPLLSSELIPNMITPILITNRNDTRIQPECQWIKITMCQEIWRSKERRWWSVQDFLS